jgi:RNA polymerase sigma factor (sigma-70 family)
MQASPSQLPEDEEIILGIMYQDQSCLLALRDKHGPKVLGYLRRRFANLDEMDREHVFNLSLFKIWKTAKSFDSKKASLSSWFVLNARSVALTFLRGESKHKHDELTNDSKSDELIYDRIEYECPEEWYKDPEIDWQVQEMQRYIDELDGLQKAVILADIASGREADNEVLANTFKTSKATVYSTRTQVWKKLGERLDKLEAQRRKEKGKS